jgi:hypothetical protein
MTIKLNGKVVERTNRNDLHNTFSPKHHKPSRPEMDRSLNRPPYKLWYENQLKNNKFLLLVITILLFLGVSMCLGMDMRYKLLNNDLEALQHEFDRNAELAEAVIIRSNELEVELASCSAKLQEKKLSTKAKSHVKQQPVVAEKIKYVFGSEWAEATELYSRESSLNPLAINENGGACGLVQFYPCSKLTTKCLLSDVDCQLKEGKKYIENRYGSVTKALAFHDTHNYY